MPDESVEHTIAICNYDMADTLERSLRSIVDQVHHRDDFEVLVVADGSSDRSLESLKRLSEEYDCLRVEYLDYDPDRGLGGTRNISFEKSRGEYVLESLDTDDIYHEGILDFVEVYHQLDDQVDFDFYLQGQGITMAKRELLLDIPYRNLPRGQDKDLRRRLQAQDALVWVLNEPFRESIGYDPGPLETRRIWFEEAVTDFRTGITLSSYVRWALGLRSIRGLFLVLIAPVAYLVSRTKQRYDPVEEFRDQVEWKRQLEALKGTLDELEDRYNVTFDHNRLSNRGREHFVEFSPDCIDD
jgi:glycosyltransferase involved in cell wall biosynthesis